MAKMHKYQPVIQLGTISETPTILASTLMSPTARVWLRESRLKWGSRMEFLLSCVGMAIGIGNVWRFPYMVYKNGGASFIISYVVLLVTVCIPMYFLETAIGQFSSLSAIDVWKCCPMAKGIGWGMSLASMYTCIYYNVLVAYCVYYACASFGSPLPWEKCENEWNDHHCFVMHSKNDLARVTAKCAVFKANSSVCPYETAPEQYWLKRVIRLSSSISNLGYLRWDLTMCLFFCWMILWLVIVRGIRTSGKAVVLTAMSPYVLLSIFFIRAVFLSGAVKGIVYLLVPDWKRLLDTEVWRGAAEQMFYSTSLSWGVVTMLSSYNEFTYTCMHDAVLVVLLDFSASLVTSITIFSVLGKLSKDLQLDIGDVVHVDPGLAFVIYPEVVSLMPASNFWGVLFFVMVFTLGLDSEFAQLEAYIANMRDAQPFIGRHTFLFTFFVCFLSFLCGLPLVMEGGIFLLSVLDHYTATTNVLLLGFLELIVLMWIYGGRRLRYDIEFMLETRLSGYWIVSWGLISPLILAVLCVSAWINFRTVSFRNYEFLLNADIIGACISYSTILPVPCLAVYTLYKYYKKGLLYLGLKANFLTTLLANPPVNSSCRLKPNANIKKAWRPERDWGPENPFFRSGWAEQTENFSTSSSSSRVPDNLSLASSPA